MKTIDIGEIGFVNSKHYEEERFNREKAIRSIGGEGKSVIAKFYWNKNHEEGAEWHWITDNGVIIVTNESKNDGKLVTSKLIARPQQLKRYAEMGMPNELTEETMAQREWRVPQYLMNKAIVHQRNGLNHS
jgi:hypothetical protein